MDFILESSSLVEGLSEVGSDLPALDVLHEVALAVAVAAELLQVFPATKSKTRGHLKLNTASELLAWDFRTVSKRLTLSLFI